MTKPLTQAELSAIYNLAVGYTEGYKAPYTMLNIWTGYKNSVGGSFYQNQAKVIQIKGATYEQVVAYQAEKDANGNPTAKAVEANTLINTVKGSLGNSGYSFSMGQLDLGKRGGEPATKYGVSDSNKDETLAAYMARKITADTGSAITAKQLTWSLEDFKNSNETPGLKDSEVTAVQSWIGNQGKLFVDQIDASIKNETVKAVNGALNTLAQRGWSESDLTVVTAYLEKTYNQNPSAFGKQNSFLAKNPNATLADLKTYTSSLNNKALAADKAGDAAEVLAALKSSNTFSGLWDSIVQIGKNNNSASYASPEVKAMFGVMEGGALKQVAACIRAADDANQVEPLLFKTSNGMGVCDTVAGKIYLPESGGKYSVIESNDSEAGYAINKGQTLSFSARATADGSGFNLSLNGQPVGSWLDTAVGVIGTDGRTRFIDVPMNAGNPAGTTMSQGELAAIDSLLGSNGKDAAAAASTLQKTYGWDTRSYDITDADGRSLGEKKIGGAAAPGKPVAAAKKVDWNPADEVGPGNAGNDPNATIITTTNPDNTKTVEYFGIDPVTGETVYKSLSFDAQGKPTSFVLRADKADGSFQESESNYSSGSSGLVLTSHAYSRGMLQGDDSVTTVVDSYALGGRLRVVYEGDDAGMTAVSASDNRGALRQDALDLLNNGDISIEGLTSGKFSAASSSVSETLMALAEQVNFGETAPYTIGLADSDDRLTRTAGDKFYYETEVNGKDVVLAIDVDTDATAGTQASVVGIKSVNGQLATNSALVNAALQDADINAHDILLGRGTGEFTQLITAADPTDADGVIAVEGSSTQSGHETAWYATAEAQRFGNILTDVQSLLAALKGGSPLPVAVAVFNMAATFTHSAELGTIGGALSTVASLKGFRDSLARGDELSALASGSVFVKTALQGVQGILGAQISTQYGSVLAARTAIDEGDQLAQEMVGQFDGVGAAINGIAQGLPYLNLINAISKGDELGMVSAGLAIAAQFTTLGWAGPVGWAIVGIQMLSSIFGDDDHSPDIRGSAQWQQSSDGKTVAAQLTLQGADGGGAPVTSAMNSLLAGLQTVIHNEFPQNDMGLIAARLPWLSFAGSQNGGGEFTLHWKDSHNGETYARRFSAEGDFVGVGEASGQIFYPLPLHISPQDLAVGEIANSPDFFKNLGQQFVEIATGKLQGDSAVVQGWESQTALAQANRGAPLAGLNTEQAARALGLWLGTNPGNATPGNTGGVGQNNHQTVRPIVLDLDNNGISITTRAQGGSVLVDVDDDGFAEETDWINPRDGILVIDKNGDAEITGGAEMFNDAQVNMAARGLNVLQALDADGNNKLTAGDFAFSHLQVWQDINHDGVAQSYELASLASKGITELNISTGRFVMGGASRAMQAMSLNADSAGFMTQDLGNSLLVIQETGDTRLMATALADYGQSSDAAVRAAHTHSSADGVLVAVDELMDGLEDTAIQVSAAQLLDNDRAGMSGALSISAVGNAVGGSVSFDPARGMITFRPGANFNGVASFGYTVIDGQGRSSVATALVGVAAVDDAPVIINSLYKRSATWEDLYSTTYAVDNGDHGSGQAVGYSLPMNMVLGDVLTDTRGLTVFSTVGASQVGFKDGQMYVSNSGAGQAARMAGGLFAGCASRHRERDRRRNRGQRLELRGGPYHALWNLGP